MTEAAGEQDPRDPAVPPAEDSVESRAELLPEEQVAGSDDPEGQAQVILEESAERTESPRATQQESVQSPDVDAEDG